MRKLDLPPKFASALSSPHSVMLSSQELQNSTISDPITVSSICTQPTTVTVAIHPQMPHFIQPPLQQPQTLAVPIATFHSNHLGQNQTFAITSAAEVHVSEVPKALPSGSPIVSQSQCVLQEQLLMKHAELQRQIMQQQEELRRVSEQLLMAQCGFVQGATLDQSQPTSTHLSSTTSLSNSAHQAE